MTKRWQTNRQTMWKRFSQKRFLLLSLLVHVLGVNVGSLKSQFDYFWVPTFSCVDFRLQKLLLHFSSTATDAAAASANWLDSKKIDVSQGCFTPIYFSLYFSLI